MTTRHSFLALLLVAAACSSHPSNPTPSAAPAAPADAARPAPPSGIDLAGMDRAVAPGDDFFAYANGTWMKTTEIPPDRASFGARRDRSPSSPPSARPSSSRTRRRASAPAGLGGAQDRRLLRELSRRGGDREEGPRAAAAGARRASRRSRTPPASRARSAARCAPTSTCSTTRNFDTDNLFGLWVAQDLDDPTRYAPFLLQGGLEHARSRLLPRSVAAHGRAFARSTRRTSRRMLERAGIADADGEGEAHLRARDARSRRRTRTRVDTEDVAEGQQPLGARRLRDKAPGLDWDGVLRRRRARQAGRRSSSGSRRRSPAWRRWCVESAARDVEGLPRVPRRRAATRASCPRRSSTRTSRSTAQTLDGTPQQRERWKRAVDATDDALGEAVGKLYVAKYFPPAEKARAEAMVKNIARRVRAAHRQARRGWRRRRRRRRKAKLAALKVGVGYPDKWRDYSGLEVVRGDALGNAERAALFEYQPQPRASSASRSIAASG